MHFSLLHWMEVSGQFYRQGQNFRNRLERKLGGSQSGSGRGEEKNACPSWKL
jgi:hypothetical protein